MNRRKHKLNHIFRPMHPMNVFLTEKCDYQRQRYIYNEWHASSLTPLSDVVIAREIQKLTQESSDE
jgi:hypothetical protein